MVLNVRKVKNDKSCSVLKEPQIWGTILLITYGFQKNSRNWHSCKTKWMIHTPTKFHITSRILNTFSAKLVTDFGLITRGTTDNLSWFDRDFSKTIWEILKMCQHKGL